MPTRKQRIKSMERFVAKTDYDPNYQQRYRSHRPNIGERIGGAIGDIGRIFSSKKRGIESRIDTRNKLLSRKHVRYQKTMRDLMK